MEHYDRTGMKYEYDAVDAGLEYLDILEARRAPKTTAGNILPWEDLQMVVIYSKNGMQKLLLVQSVVAPLLAEEPGFILREYLVAGDGETQRFFLKAQLTTLRLRVKMAITEEGPSPTAGEMRALLKNAPVWEIKLKALDSESLDGGQIIFDRREKSSKKTDMGSVSLTFSQ